MKLIFLSLLLVSGFTKFEVKVIKNIHIQGDRGDAHHHENSMVIAFSDVA